MLTDNPFDVGSQDDDVEPWSEEELDELERSLSYRTDVLADEYAANEQHIADLLACREGLTGRGEAANGAIVVTLDSAHRIVDLKLEPAALRLGSISSLKSAIIEAFDKATTAIDTKIDKAVSQIDDPRGSYGDRMPELSWLPSVKNPRLEREQLKKNSNNEIWEV